MEDWKWHLAEAGLFFIGGMAFVLAITVLGVDWWAAVVIPLAFLPSGVMLVRALRERRRGRRHDTDARRS